MLPWSGQKEAANQEWNSISSLRLEDTGSIEEGKFVDFVIIDKNIFEIPENEISGAKVLLTYFQGNKVYDSTLPEQQDNYDELIEAIERIVDEVFIMKIT